MSDNTLTTLMGNVPNRCILLLEDLDAAFTRSVSRDSNSTGAPVTVTADKEKEKEKEVNDGNTLSLSGLLNSLDGVAAAEGRYVMFHILSNRDLLFDRLLFATTNHIERLDPALSRPGRMDVWVNFTNATKWQAEGIFKCFFPSAKPSPRPAPSSTDPSQRNLPGIKKTKVNSSTPMLLSEEEISELAKAFGNAIPEDELSVRHLSCFLSLTYICLYFA
jgi:mitochondrial chaperone BCS1